MKKLLKNSNILLFITSFLLGISFIILSFLVAKDFFNTFDFDTTVRLQDNISRKVDLLFSLFSLIGSFESTLGIITIFFFLLYRRNKKIIISIILFFILLHLIEIAGKLLIYHPGPPFMFFRYNLGLLFPSSYVNTSYSYPSGHMARTLFVLILFIFYLFQMIKNNKSRYIISIFAFIYVFLMFISRIYLGEHWFSDVVGGGLLGATMAILSLMFW